MKMIVMALVMAGLISGCGTSSVRGNGSSEKSSQAMASDKSGSTQKSDNGSPGKPALPVQVQADLGQGKGTLILTASSTVEQLKVEVWGTRGADVEADVSGLVGHRLAGGDSARLELSWKGGADGDVAIRVTGISNGREQSVVRSFSLSPNRKSESEKAGEDRVDDQGRKVKVMSPN